MSQTGLRQIEQELGAAFGRQHDAPAMAVMGIKRNCIAGAGAIPVTGGDDFARMLHDRVHVGVLAQGAGRRIAA